jgi:hypothetical protein
LQILTSTKIYVGINLNIGSGPSQLPFLGENRKEDIGVRDDAKKKTGLGDMKSQFLCPVNHLRNKMFHKETESDWKRWQPQK